MQLQEKKQNHKNIFGLETSDDQTITVENIVENGDYYIWVKDNAGNVNHIKQEVTTVTFDSEKIKAIILNAPKDELKGKEYESFAELTQDLNNKEINASSGEVLVQIVKDIDENLTVSDKDITIDLNGYTISSSSEDGTIVVESGNLRILDNKLSIQSYIQDPEKGVMLKDLYKPRRRVVGTIKNISGVVINNKESARVEILGGKIENSEIVQTTIKNSGNLEVVAGNVETKASAIENSAEGTVTLGMKDFQVNNQEPRIEKINCNDNDYYTIENYGGKINFYDGIVIASQGRSIHGVIDSTEDDYDIKMYMHEQSLLYEVDEGKEIAVPQTVNTILVNSTGKKYSSLNQAISETNDQGDNITLLEDVEVEESDSEVQIPENKNISLDLAGCKLISAKENVIDNNGYLKIEDSKLNGRIEGKNVGISNEGTLEIISGEIVINGASSNSAGINNESTGTVILGIKDAQVTTNEPNIKINGDGNSNFGILNNNGGELNFYDGKITMESEGKVIDGEITGCEDGYKVKTYSYGETDKYEVEEGQELIVLEEIRQASIASISYQQLQTAINSATDGQIVSVTDDIAKGELTTNIVIPADKNITIDLAGHEINLSEEVQIINEGNLTLTNNIGEGRILSNYTAIDNYGTLKIIEGTISTDDGKAYKNADLCAVKNNELATLEVSGGLVYGIINDGTTTIKSGKISSHYGIVNTGTTKVEGGQIIAEGSAIVNKASGKVNMTGGQINNSAYATISNEEEGVVEILSGTINSSSYIENKDSANSDCIPLSFPQRY